MKLLVIHKNTQKVTAEFTDLEHIINGKHIKAKSDDGRIGKGVFTLEKNEFIRIKEK